MSDTHALPAQKPKPGRPAATVQHVCPKELLGIAYKDLTRQQSKELREFRIGLGRCYICGYSWHLWMDCYAGKQKRKYRKENRLCLYCGKPGHDHEKCGLLASIKRAIGPVGILWEVPPKLVGIAYKYMSEEQRRSVYRWRWKEGLCIRCGGTHELDLDCPSYKRQLQAEQSRKAKAIKAKKISYDGLTGPFARLPAELRLAIWEYATASRREIELARLCFPRLLLASGIPFNEVFEAWIKGNTFYIYDFFSLNWFWDVLSSHGAWSFVRAIRLGFDPDMYLHGNDERSQWIFDFLYKCSGLRSIKLDTAPASYWDDAKIDVEDEAVPAVRACLEIVREVPYIQALRLTGCPDLCACITRVVKKQGFSMEVEYDGQ